jgi:pimeloyl-ACP methyl ester carboxylesterase
MNQQGSTIVAKCQVWKSTFVAMTLGAFLVISMSSHAQIAQQTRLQRSQRFTRRVAPQGRGTLALITPLTTKEGIPEVTCPPDAAAAGAAICGYVPVPLHRDRPDGETIHIYFEVYAHSNPGPAESAIVANAGGPALTTSGLRFLWLGLFGANLDAHDLLLIDDRGRGMSALIDCQELQHGTGTSIDQEVTDCAAQLGDGDSSYGTGDVALDVEAVRAALGYEKLDYYGGSYGAMDASAYATRFGEHLRSVILDSPAGQPSLVPFVQRYSTAAVPREVRLDCLRSPTCTVDHPNPDAELDWLIRKIRNKPVQGAAHDPNGNPVDVDFNEGVLTQIATSPNFGYLDIGELLAAGEALRRGDDLPLLRLGAEGFTPIVSDFGDPAFVSIGAYAATWCVDNPMPFQWSSPPEVRLVQYADAVEALPPDYFAPFSKAASTGIDILGDSRDCVFWEEPRPPAPVIPIGATYPRVPTLAFNSDIDPVVPTELAIPTTALFPESTLLIVKSGMHEPVESNLCAASIAANFIETLEAGDTSCTQGPEIVWPALGRFPLFARDARAAEVDPSGKNEIDVPERKVVTVAVETALDALKRSTIGSGNGASLRGLGTFKSVVDVYGNQTTMLQNCEFAQDVTVNGTITWASDHTVVADLTVSGAGAALGTLHVEGTFEAPGPVGFFKISGILGGRTVDVIVPEA